MSLLNLNQAFAILMFFYLVGAVVQTATGEPVHLVQLPEITAEPGENNAVSLIVSAVGGIVGLVNAFLSLITIPFGVINLVDFGFMELNIAVKSVLFIVLAYVYMVVLNGIKNIISPFS